MTLRAWTLDRFKEAINECSSALEVDAVYAKALTRRAKAYEAMGHYKQALSDIQKANKADSANPDTQVFCALQKHGMHTCCKSANEHVARA